MVEVPMEVRGEDRGVCPRGCAVRATHVARAAGTGP